MKEINLKNPLHWHGVWTALITPLNPQGDIDTPSLEKLIEEQIKSGITGLIIAGSTGEGSLLNDQRYKQLLESSLKIAKKRIPLVAGVGIGGTEESLRRAKLAIDCGFEALLCAPPAYIKTPQRGLEKHFLALADLGAAICLYDVPGRAASSIQLETYKALLESSHPSAKNIVALKDATADILLALKEHQLFQDRWALLSGDDFTFQPFLAVGGQGLISVATHIAPDKFLKIYQLSKNSKQAEAAQIQNSLLPLVEGLFWESNPIPVKSLCHKLGKIQHNVFCEPLVPMREELLQKLSKVEY